MVHIFETELIQHVPEYDVVLVGMGINGSFSSGFANEIKVNFPEVKEAENAVSPYGDRTKYGTICPIDCSGVTFCMCYMHNGGYCKKEGREYLSYENLRECLETVAKKYGGKKIGSPLIGASKHDGAGDKGAVLEIYNKAFKDCDIDVYDYEQDSFRDRMYKKICLVKKMYKEGSLDREDYELTLRRLCWIRDHGIFKIMPADYDYKKRFSWDGVITVKKEDLEK